MAVPGADGFGAPQLRNGIDRLSPSCLAVVVIYNEPSVNDPTAAAEETDEPESRRTVCPASQEESGSFFVSPLDRLWCFHKITKIRSGSALTRQRRETGSMRKGGFTRPRKEKEQQPP